MLTHAGKLRLGVVGAVIGGPPVAMRVYVNPSVSLRSTAPRKSNLRFASSLGEGAFWCGTNSNIKPALKGDSSRARPVGDAARGESGGIGSIASGSVARRPYSNQRCGFRVAKAGGVIKRLIALCLSQPLSLTSFDSSPAGEPFCI